MGNLNYPPQKFFVGTEKKPLVLTFGKINQTFQKNVGSSGFLDLASFNKCLNDLTQFGNFPKLAYTYLSERSYEMLTNNGTVNLTCERFAMALLTVLSCNDTRSLILFNAIKRNPNSDSISFNEIFDFFRKSWASNFKYIYDYINYCLRDEFTRNNIIIPSNPQELYGLINLHEDELKNYLMSSLYDSDYVNIDGPMKFDCFKKWALKDHSTEISYGGKVFRFANSFTFMDNIGFNTHVN